MPTLTANHAEAIDIPMPKLSDSMEEGTVIKWLVPDGAEVTAGQEVVEIETDKATMAYEAGAAGTLQRLVATGTTVPVGSPIARVLVPGASPAATSPAQPASSVVPPVPAGAESRKRRVSALAKRAAAQLGVDLPEVTGSGPRGRVMKVDVIAHQGPERSDVTAAPGGDAPGPVLGPGTDIEPVRTATSGLPAHDSEPLTRTQQLIAQRMAESRATIPEFTLTTTIDMEACVQLRDELKASGGEAASRPSLNDLIIRAAALALREHPNVNASYRDGRIHYHAQVNIGIAVAAPGTLLVPTVTAADRMSISAIASTTRRATDRAREGTITAAEMAGATFTISNLGMAGVDNFTAVINPPQAAILAVGRVARQPTVVGDEIFPRWQVQVSLSCDHRIVYGADGAAFLQTVRSYLESPLQMI